MIGQNTHRPEEIPAHLWPGIRAYVLEGQAVGSFLQAVLTNDLKGAVAYADDASLDALPDIVKWLYNESPAGCWGSPEHYTAWLGENGMQTRRYPAEAESAWTEPKGE